MPRTLIVFLGLTVASSALAQVPDCTHFKQEELHSPAPLRPIVPASKLLNFCSPERVSGEFFVKIKDNEALIKDLSPEVIRALEVLPRLIPDTKQKCAELGQALADKHHAKLSKAYCEDKFRFFIVSEISDEEAAAMAQDPRIEYLEPDIRTSI